MSTKMKAIILAAGKGTRLYPLTLEKPKCLLEVGGKSVIDRQIAAIHEMGIEDVVVVVGYKKEVIMSEVGAKVRYRAYHNFEETNNLHTLWSVKDELNNAFICLFSDLIFDTDVIRKAMESNDDICMVCNTHKILEGTMRIKLTDGKFTGVGGHIPVSEGSGNFLGIAKFSKRGANLLVSQMGEMVSGHKNDYYTIAIDVLAKKGIEIGYVNLHDSLWIEIDTREDLDRARQLLSNRSI